jgi:putative peptide-modifying radical SAM enzyme
MNFYVTLTTKCNLRCSYCYGKSCEDFGSDFHGLSIDYSVPSSISYQTDQLRDFLKHYSDPVVIFYGGEPLLRLDKIREIMDANPAARFVVQTNGLLLDKLQPQYLRRFESVFVSLDGNEALTDSYRGRGTYSKVTSNLRRIRDDGFDGEIIARMTVEEATEIDTQVLALINSSHLPVSSVHWQLDALFWQNDYPKRRFAEWAAENYSPRLRKLVRAWVNHMNRHGEVWRLYPFVGIMESMLSGRPSHLRCGAGWCVFNIQTDGNITPCPVMAGMKDFYLGKISETTPKALKDSVFVSEPCTSCQIFKICGGRCLYANVTKLWGNEGFKHVCKTVVNMVDALNEVKTEVESLIENGVIQRSDFVCPQYNGCEVIP